MDGLLVVGIVIIGLHRHALAPEGMVLGYQLFRDRRVLDARPDLVGDEFGEKIVALLVEQQLAESAKPDAIARRVVERLEQGVALFFRTVTALASVGVLGRGSLGEIQKL